MTNDGEEPNIEDDPTIQIGVSHKDLSPATVYFLDGKKKLFYIHKNSEGEILIDMVGKYLQLQERDYFGLTYYDQKGNKHWVYSDRRISKKLKSMPWEFYFEVKFYPQEPSQLADDFTRYLLCLQVRQDIYMKKLPVTFATEALLASYVVQELRGDYHEYPPLLDYVSFLGEAKTSESITPEFVEKVKELHKQHKGLTPGEAESAYLEVAKKLNMYGIFTFPAKDNHNDVIIGISAPGISVFSDQVRVHRFLWNHIVKFAYKKNIFSVKVKPDKAVNGKSTFSYKMDDNGNAKRTWRCGVEHHTFFRLIQPEDDLKNGVICAPRGNRIFHYHGRTQYQSKLHASMFDHVSSDINRSDNIRVGKSEVCYIKPVEILDDRDKIESNVEHPVSVNLMDEENFVTPVKESRSNKNQFTKDTLNSSGYGSGPSSSRVRFADRLPIKLEGKKVRRNLFGKGKEDDIERETFPAIASTYPKDKEESKTDIVLTNNEFDEIPIDYMVSVYHNGQSINNKKRNNVCCGSIGGGNKKGHIKKDDISEPMTLTEDVEKYPLRYKVDVYHSGGRYSQKYGINKNKKKFKRLTHEGVNEVVKRDKVDLTFYPHDNSEHPVKERLEKVYELECEPLRKYASKYHSGLSVMSKKEAKEQKKIAKRDRLLTHESTPPKNSKSKCFSCNCAGSQLPKDKSSKMKFDDNYPYGLSKEPYEGPLSMERRKEEFKGAPLESVCSSYEIPKYKPANKKRSSALTCIKPQKRVKKDEEYSRKDSWPKDDEEERHHVVKKMLRDEDYPIEERKQKTEFIEKIEERPIIEYDVARTVIDTEKDWSLKVGEGKESGIKKTTRISKTLLPQRTSSPHSSNENIDGHCHVQYDSTIEVSENKDKLDNIPIESEVKIHHTPEHIITKVEEIKTFKEPSYNDIDIPSSSHVYEIKTTTNIYNLNTEPYEGNVEVISKNNDIDEDPLSEHVKYYDIPKYPKKFEKKIEVKESIIRTQNIENEKLSPIIQKEVSFSNDNQDSSAKKEKTNSLTRFIGRFNKKDSDVGKKKQGPVMSDLDSGVDDILSGTEAGTLSRKDDQKEDIKEAKKLEKKKKKSLLCSSTGKKGSMAYLPIEHIRHSSSDKGYPGKEEPYTGDLEPFNKTSELPTESLRNIVQVYHSGLSDVKPSWNRRFVIFSRTKHEGVEEVIDKNEINKESYQLLNNQPYEGPLETMRHDDDISTEPIKHYSKVYHPGQSVLGGTKKKENVKKSSKKRVSTPVDSDEDDYHPKDKTSSLSRFMGFFNRRGGKSNNYDTGNGGMTTENDSGMDASNSSAEVPTKYSLESYDKKNKNKNRKYVLNTEPFLGTYDQTIRINELQTEPLKDSVDVYHSGQSVSTLKNKKLYLNDQYTESDTDDERRNTRSNTLTRIIGKLHMPKKSNGGNGSDLGYPKISQKYEGEYEKINRIDEVKKIPLDQEVQIYDIPKYQAKIEKKDSEPSCSYCAPVGRKQSLNVYDKNEELSGDENTLSKTENKSLKASNDKDIKLSIETDIEGKYKDPKLSSEKDITATVMVPESMVNDDLMISIPEDAFEGKDIDRNINAHIIIDNEPKLKVRSRSKKNNVSCFGKSKSKPINLEAYPPQVKYDGATMDLKTSHSLPKTSLEDHVDIYPIPKYQDKKKYSKKCSAFNCVRKNRMEEKGNDYYMEKTSSDKSEDESHLEAKAKVGIESRKPELEAFYEMPSKEKVVEVKTSNNLESELEIENKKQKTKCVSLNCAKNSPDHKSEGTYEVSPKKFNISNEYNDKIEAEDIHMTVLVPEEMASGKVKISVPDTSFKIPEEDIKAHIVIDEPEIEKYTTTFEHKKGGLSYVASFGDNNYTYEPSVEVKHDIPSFEKGVKIETPKLNIDAELKKPKVKEPKCGQLNCAKQSPKKEFDVSYEISQHKADLNLEMPEVNIDREVKLEMPEVNIDREVKLEVEVPTGNINIETPIPEIQPMEIEIKEPAVHVEMPQLNIDTEIKEPKVKGPKCGSLNCSKKKMEGDFDASYELSPKHIELKTELPKVEVENDVEVKLLVPEHLAESDFKVSIPEVSVDLPSHDMKAHILVEKPKVSLPEIKVKPRKTGVSCFACFGRKKGKLPANLDAYPQQYTYEGPIVELDSQMPMKTEKLDQHVNLYPIPKYKNKGKVGKKCGSLSCGGKKPSSDIEVGYTKPYIKVKTDAPSVKGDLEVDIPEIKAEADIKKPEVQIDAKKPKVKGPKCAPLSCFRKTPKAGLEASYDIPSKKLDVDIETPEVKVDVEGPSVKVDVPEIHADIKKPEVQIDAKKPKVKGPKCAPLSCFRKTSKAGLEASYDIPSKKLDVDVEGPSIEVDAPEITAEASIDKPEIKIDAKKPKVKGPKCAPLSCFRKTPKAGLEASYDIPSKKLDVDIETPEVNVDVEGPSVKVDVPEIHADIKKPEIQIDVKKPKAKGPRCAPLSCFRKTPKAGLEASYNIPSKKIDVDVETPEVNIDVEGSSVKIDTEVPDLKLDVGTPEIKLDIEKPSFKANVPELHADIKKPEVQIDAKKPKIKGPKCAPLSCLRKTPKAGLEASYDIPSKKLDVDVEGPSIEVNAPQLTAEASIDKPEIKIDAKKPKVKGPRCAPLSCFRKTPKAGLEASYDIPSKKLDVDIETPEVNIDVEGPSVKVDVPEVHADIKKPEVQIDAKKPKIKGPKCAPLSCLRKTPKAGLEASYDIPSKKLDVDVEGPSIEVNAPQLTAEASIDKPEIKIDAKKPKVKGPKCAPLSCFRKTPKAGLEASYDIPSKKLDVDIETPEVNVDVEGPSVKVDVPEIHADIKKPEIQIDVKKPKAKGPRCAPLSCFRKTPKAGLEASYDIPSKKLDVDVEGLSIEVDAPEITAEASIDKPEIKIDAKKPKTKGPKCAPLSCFRKTPKAGLEASYDIPSNKLDVDIETPEVNIDVEGPSVKVDVPEVHADIKKPEVQIDAKKPKIKGPKCAPLSCFRKTPKAGLEASYDIPSKKLDVDIEGPSIEVDAPKLTAEASIDKPEIKIDAKKPKTKGPKCAPLSCFRKTPKAGLEASYDIPSKKLDVDIEGPSIEVDTPKLTAEVSIDKPEIKIDAKKPKVKGPRCAPLSCFRKTPKAGLEASYDIPSKKLDVDVEGPSIEVDAPQLTAEADIKKPEIQIDAKKPKVKGPKCAPLSCLRKTPKAGLEASYDIPSKKLDVDVEGPSIEVNVPQLTAEASIDKPEIKIDAKKPKVKRPKCAPLSCFRKTPKAGLEASYDIPSKKIDVDVETPEVNVDVEGPSVKVDVPELHADFKKPEIQIDVKKPKARGPRCAPLSCFRKTPKAELEASYDIPSKKLDVDVEGPSIEVDAPEITAEASIDKPEIKIDAKKPKVKGPRCAPLSCFRRTPKAGLEASYDIPSKKLNVDIETPEVNIDVEGPSVRIDTEVSDLKLNVGTPEIKLDIEKPSFKADVPELHADIKKPEIKIDTKKPKVKGPKCAPLSCLRKTPKAGLEASYDIPSKKFDVDVEGPSIEVNAPQLTAEASIDKPEIKIDAKKPKVKGPKCAPLSCFRKTPKAGLEASYDIPSKKIDVDVETPEVNVDVEGPSVKVDVPELHADFKKPEIQIDVKKPKARGPRCAPLSCFRKTPKAELEASYDIPSKKLDVDVEGPSIEVDAPEITAEASIDKPEIKIDAKKPKVKGPRCAPLSCFRKTSKAGLEASYDILSKKLDVDIETPEVNVDVEGPSVKVDIPEVHADIKKPEIQIDAKKPKVKGPKCAPLSCFRKTPKAGLEASYDIPSKKLDVDVEGPSIEVDAPQLTAEADIKKPEIQIDAKKPKVKGPKCAPLSCLRKTPKAGLEASYDIPSKKLDVDVEGPSIEVNAPQLTAEASIDKPEIKIDAKKPKVKGPKCAPLSCFRKTPKAGLEASYDIPSKKLDVDIETPEVNVDVEGPSVKVDVPEIHADIKKPEIQIDVKKPKAKGPRCAPLSCFRKKPKAGLEASYDIPSKKLDVDVEGPSIEVDAPEITAEASIDKPEIKIDAKKPKVKGPKCAPLSCFRKTPKAGLEASYDIPSKKLDVDIETPEVNVDVEGPSVKVDIPEVHADIKKPEVQIDAKKPKIKGPKCAPLSCFRKTPKAGLEASYDIPSKKLDVDIEGPSIEVDAPKLTAEASINKPEIKIDAKKPKTKGPKCAPLSCFRKTPKAGLEASYDIPSRKLDVDIETPEVNVDVEGPSVKVDIPEVHADIKKPEIQIDAKKPKIKGPKCAPLSCFRKTPKAGLEASYDIPSKKLDVDIEGPSIEVDAPQLTAEADIKKPEVQIDAKKPKVKGPKCAPLSCFRKTPKAELEASYDIPSKKLDVDVEGPSIEVNAPQLTAEASIDKPEINIDAKKPKVKGPICAPLSCLRKTPKAEFEASYDIPSKKLDVDVEGPSIEVDAPKLTAEADIEKPEVQIDAKKPKVKGPRCVPLSCFRKTPKAGLEASYDIPSKKLDVDFETPEVNVDVEGPSVKVDVPEIHADIKKPEIQIDVKKPKAKGPKCGKLNCVKKTPEVELDSSYKLPTIKNDLQIELPDVKIENDIKLKTESLMPHGDIEIQSFDVDVKAPKVDVTIPKLEIDTKIKGPKVKGPKFSPPHFGKRTYETDFDASCELSPKKLHLDMETPDFNYEIKKPEVELPSFELPSSKIEFEQPKIDIDRNVKLEVEVPSRSINIEAPEIVGEFKKPEIDFDASYEVSPKHIELKTELPRVNVENDIEIKLLVPEHLAESDFKVSIPEPSIDFPSHDMKAHILVEEPKVSLPEIKVKPRKTGVSCFACFGRKKGKLPANLDAYPQQQAYEGPVVELGSEMPMKTEKLDQHVDLYPIPKYKNKGKVDKKCGALNCAGKKQSPDIEVSYTKPDIEVKTDVPSVQGDIKVDVEHPITSVHIPEVKAEADIKKPKVEIEKSKKITPKCGSLNCFRKAPRDEYEASYDIITKQIQSGYLTNENDGKDIQVNVLVPEHLVNENLKISLPENALEMDGSDIKGYISIENEKYLQPIAKEPLKKSLKLRRPLSCFSNKNRNKGNEVNVKELKNVYESHYPLLLTSNENELERIDKDKELERQIIGDYVQVYQIPKYKPLNKKSTINCGINSCISKDKNIPTESANDKHESSWGIIGEGLTKTTGEVYYPSTKLDIKNYPQSEAWTGHVETMTHQSPLKSEPLHSHCNLYDVPKYAPSVEVNIPKHKQHFGFEYKAEGPDIVVESRDETVDGMVTPFSTPVTTPANFESNIPQSIKIYEDSLQKELNFDYNIPKIEITKEESSVNIQVPSLTVTSYDEPISTSKNEDNKHKMSVESLKFVHDLEEKLNLHVSINENNEQPILEQINDGQIDIVLPPPPLAIKEAEKELPHPKSKFLGCIPRKDKRVKQKNKQLTDGGDSGISTDDDNEHSSNKKNSLSNFSCMPFMCNGNKNKRLESPYIKATSGQPQQFGISTKKYSGEHIAIEPITEMETNPLSQHVSKYHSGESYVKPKTHFHLLPSCIKKQDSVKRKSKNDKDKIVSDEKLNNELDVLEYQRVTDTSKTLTSMFTTTDPLSGDLNCHLTITLLQKMDCECKVIFCRTDNEEVGACCKSCAYSKCYQTLSATVNMNNMTNGVPEITISQPSKPSLLSILKKPFKGTNKNKKDENYKKISKKNKTSHYSSDSSSNSADIKEKEEEKEKNIIDAVVPTNDQYKLNSQNSAANMVLNNSNNVSLNKPPINSSSTGIHQNNMRSSVLNGTVSLEQSSGPYREAEPSDGEVIREERIEHVYKLRGTGNAPTIDPSDMSLSATLAKCVEENSSLPRVTMVCKDVHVKDYGILEPYITEESNLPHTTIQSWQETDVGPDTVYTETDPSGKVTKKTIKTQQTKHTIQKQSYQTFNVDDNMLPPKNTTIDKTIKVTTPRVGSGTKGPVMETRTRTVAYECHPEEALVTKDGDIPGEFVSSKTVTTGNKTIETITYKTEKDGIVETRVEHKVTIHSDDGVDHDAELSQALLDATSMDPDMTVETIEIKQETQN